MALNLNRHHFVTHASQLFGVTAIKFALILILNVSQFADKSEARFERTSVDSDTEKIEKIIREGNLLEAENRLESLIQNEPLNLSLQKLRLALGNAFFRQQNRIKGESQFQLLFGFLASHPERSRELHSLIPRILLNLSPVQRGQEPVARILLDRGIKLLRSSTYSRPDDMAISNGLSTLIGLRARMDATRGDFDNAKAIFVEELNRLRQNWRTHPSVPNHLFRLSVVLQSAIDTLGGSHPEATSSWSHENHNVLKFAANKFQSSDCVERYMRERAEFFQHYFDDAPNVALPLIANFDREVLNLIQKQKSKKTLYLVRIELNQKLQIQRREYIAKSLTGTTAPALPTVDWINDDYLPGGRSDESTELLVFINLTSEHQLSELLQLNDRLKIKFPNLAWSVLAHRPATRFSQLPFVSSGEKMTEVDYQLFRKKLKLDLIGPNHLTCRIGIVENPVAIAETFAVVNSPTAIVFDEQSKRVATINSKKWVVQTMKCISDTHQLGKSPNNR